MTINSHINKLRDRARHFIRVNTKVDFLSLKLHLECTGTDLLLALGELINEQVVELERDGWQIIIRKKDYSASKIPVPPPLTASRKASNSR